MASSDSNFADVQIAIEGPEEVLIGKQDGHQCGPGGLM